YLDQLVVIDALPEIEEPKWKETSSISCHNSFERIMGDLLCNQSSDFVWHTFSRFESIQDILVKYELRSAQEIIHFNGFSDVTEIVPGMQLKIPVLDKSLQTGISGN